MRNKKFQKSIKITNRFEITFGKFEQPCVKTLGILIIPDKYWTMVKLFVSSYYAIFTLKHN